MKIFVTGATGFLGREAAHAAVRRGHNVIAVGGARLPQLRGVAQALRVDLSRPENLEARLLEEFPDAIINCAAVPTVAACAAAPVLAAALNTRLPRFLARMANHLSARLIHVSTDMVFDGTAAPYAHTAVPAPLHAYGATKLAGEKEVLQHGKHFGVVLRAPLLCGNSESGVQSLHERLLAAAATATTAVPADAIPLYTDEIRQPVSADNLADVLVELCERDNLSGVYHWAGADALSRYEIGRRIAAHFGFDPDAIVVPAQRGPEAADRPRDLSLDLRPLRGKLKTPVRGFDEILSTLRVPSHLAPWHAALTGRAAPIPRLVKGVDF
jgi:dTDP-4-dehydrorhamnose reductase